MSYPMLESCEVHGRYFHPKGPGAIADITKSLVQKRREARSNGDKFSDSLLKIVINSGYGKTGQGLKHKRSTDLENSTKERVVTSEIPPSKITNPAIASFITGFVRGVIGELLNYLHDKGVTVLCTTTDGFTTMGRIPDEATLGVGPLSKWLYQRTGKPILELKHEGLVFTGIKTRVYSMSFGKTDKLLASAAGVNRKGCGETPQRKSVWMTRELINLYQFKRTTYRSERLPTLRDWILNDTSPGNITEYKAFNFDYDFKRMPDMDTAHDEGFVSTFLTKPWRSVEDFYQWRKAYQNYGRGKRDQEGRQTHLMNKLVNTRQLHEFVKYVQLTSIFSGEDQDLRIRTNGALRLAANIAYQKLDGLGFKKIAKLLGVNPETCRYWTRKNPLSDRDFEKREVGEILFGLLDELEKGVVSESVGSTDSLTTPLNVDQAELSLQLRVYLWWINKYQIRPEVECGVGFAQPHLVAPTQQERVPGYQPGSVSSWTLDRGGGG